MLGCCFNFFGESRGKFPLRRVAKGLKSLGGLLRRVPQKSGKRVILSQ